MERAVGIASLRGLLVPEKGTIVILVGAMAVVVTGALKGRWELESAAALAS